MIGTGSPLKKVLIFFVTKGQLRGGFGVLGHTRLKNPPNSNYIPYHLQRHYQMNFAWKSCLHEYFWDFKNISRPNMKRLSVTQVSIVFRPRNPELQMTKTEFSLLTKFLQKKLQR